MSHQWGSVDGDINADAIICDRKQEKKWNLWGHGLTMIAFVASCFWLGFEGGSGALAVTIFFASAWLGGVAHSAIFKTHTMVLIAERRAQLVEQRLQDIEFDLSLRPR